MACSISPRLYRKSFLSRIGWGESLASFWWESERLKKGYSQRHICGEEEYTTSHSEFPLQNE
jgi:hypothetical protein